MALAAVAGAWGTPDAARWPQPVAAAELRAQPWHHTASGFRNLDPDYHRASMLARAASFVVGGTWFRPEYRVAPLPRAAPDLDRLWSERGEPSVTWVGHATLLVQLDGVSILTDPTWSDRVGPLGGRLGVARYTPPGIRFEDLPRIDLVLISHDHYDHLDEPTVVRLARTFHPRFVVPLGIGSWLADRGIDNVTELDWDDRVTVKGLTLICTPAQHGSGRTLVDQQRRLWASWVVQGTRRFYFGGDTGYSPHLKAIGDAYGPFDLVALPIGSYTPREYARPVHMSPEEALQGFLDLRATRFIGIHWGTFGLARERYDEPPKRLTAEMARRHVDPDEVWVIKPGETRSW